MSGLEQDLLADYRERAERIAAFSPNTAEKDRAALLDALDAVLALAESWRYKGEFGWGAWQEGHGPDQDGLTLDHAAGEIRKAVTDTLRGGA